MGEAGGGDSGDKSWRATANGQQGAGRGLERGYVRRESGEPNRSKSEEMQGRESREGWVALGWDCRAGG